MERFKTQKCLARTDLSDIISFFIFEFTVRTTAAAADTDTDTDEEFDDDGMFPLVTFECHKTNKCVKLFFSSGAAIYHKKVEYFHSGECVKYILWNKDGAVKKQRMSASSPPPPPPTPLALQTPTFIMAHTTMHDIKSVQEVAIKDQEEYGVRLVALRTRHFVQIDDMPAMCVLERLLGCDLLPINTAAYQTGHKNALFFIKEQFSAIGFLSSVQTIGAGSVLFVEFSDN